MPTKKILFIVPHLRSGGAEKVTKLIFDYFNNLESWNSNLVVIEGQGKQVGNIYNLGKKRLRNSIFPIVKIIANQKPDIIFTSFGYITILLSILKIFFKFKLVARESNTLSQKMKEFSIFRKLFYRFSYKYLYHQCDVVIAQSLVMKDDLLQFLSESTREKLVLIPNFTKENSRLLPNVDSMKENYSPNFKLVSVGRLTLQKGFDACIEMVSRLTHKCSLDIYGEGPDKENLINLIKKCGLTEQVRLLGNISRENLLIQFQEYDYLLLCSRYEGFSNVMLEALSVGLPVIAREGLGGIHEAIIPGFNGVIYDGTAESLDKILSISYQFNRLQISKDVYLRFNSNQILKKYENLFSSL